MGPLGFALPERESDEKGSDLLSSSVPKGKEAQAEGGETWGFSALAVAVVDEEVEAAAGTEALERKEFK